MTVELPSVQNVQELLQRLLGTAPDLQSEDNGPTLSDLGRGFGSVLVDSAGEPMAAIVTDLRAALCLGGRLMMMPPGALEEDANNNEISENVLDALGEVYNNLTVCLNEASDLSVKATATQDVSEIASSELWQSASQRVDLVGDFVGGSGRLVWLKR